MKVIRSSKCSLKFSTGSKRSKLRTVIREYGRVVNLFIDYFWSLPELPVKTKLLKEIVDIPVKCNDPTWLTARMRNTAAREAIDMILSSIERWGESAKRPVHKCDRMCVFATTANLIDAKSATGFDRWLHLASVGNGIILDFPIKLHRHFNRLNEAGRRLNHYIITNDYVQFSFEIEAGAKKSGVNVVGIDTGINTLAYTSTGSRYGTDIKSCIDRVNRCEHGSMGQRRARRALRQRIDEVAKELIHKECPDLVVVERLKYMGYKGRAKRLLARNIRRSIGAWNWRHWLNRIEQQCEINRVSFRTVSPEYTSQTCSRCGYVDRMNRKGIDFMCLNCSYQGNADFNAAINIKNRFISGPYGARYKRDCFSHRATA